MTLYQNPATQVRIKWDSKTFAPGEAAFLGQVMSASSVKDIIVTSGKTTEVTIKGEGPIFVRGQLPGGLSFQGRAKRGRKAQAILRIVETQSGTAAKTSRGKCAASSLPEWAKALWIRFWTFNVRLEDSWTIEQICASLRGCSDDAVQLEFELAASKQVRLFEIGTDNTLSLFIALPPRRHHVIQLSRRNDFHGEDGMKLQWLNVRFLTTRTGNAVLDALMREVKEGHFSRANALYDLEKTRTLSLESVKIADEPYGALSLGYFLARTGRWSALNDPLDWLNRTYFSWISDFSILSAWSLSEHLPAMQVSLDVPKPIRPQVLDSGTEQIRKHLINASDGGLPVCITGLQFLQTTTMEIADRISLETEAGMRLRKDLIGRLWMLGSWLSARRNDQVLTNFYGTSPWDPRYEEPDALKRPIQDRTQLTSLLEVVSI